MNGHQIALYCLVCAFVTVAAVAIVFAILAWNDSQARRPHRRLERADIIARGDFYADGDIRTQGSLRVDNDCQIRGKARVCRAAFQSLAFDEPKRIIDAGPILLSKEHSAYRIDTPGAQTIHVQLPAVADAPMQVFLVMISRDGANNTVLVDVATGDALSDGNGPVITSYPMPVVPNNPDYVLLTNDALSTWFATAHT